jgi:hypothetical protein
MATPSFDDKITNALKSLAIDRDASVEEYQKQVLNSYQVLLDKVTIENEMILKSYPGLSVAGKKSVYVNESANTLSTINTWLFWIYIATAIILSVLIIMKPFSIWTKIIAVITVVAFPFYIYPAEVALYQLSMYIYSVLLSVVYNNGLGNTTPEYYATGMENLKKT